MRGAWELPAGSWMEKTEKAEPGLPRMPAGCGSSASDAGFSLHFHFTLFVQITACHFHPLCVWVKKPFSSSHNPAGLQQQEQREKAESIFHFCSDRCYLSGLWQQGEAVAPEATHSLCRARLRCTSRPICFWGIVSMLLARVEVAKSSDRECWALQKDPQR